MSTEARGRAANAVEEPDTPREVLEYPLERGDVAVHVENANWYVILGTCDAPAGEIPHELGGTIAEWVDCDPDADVVLTVTVERLKQSIAQVDGPDDVPRAVENGLVEPKVAVEKRLGISLEEFVEAENRGEWDGLRAYLEVTR